MLCGWLARWLVGWLVDWSVGWLVVLVSSALRRICPHALLPSIFPRSVFTCSLSEPCLAPRDDCQKQFTHVALSTLPMSNNLTLFESHTWAFVNLIWIGEHTSGRTTDWSRPCLWTSSASLDIPIVYSNLRLPGLPRISFSNHAHQSARTGDPRGKPHGVAMYHLFRYVAICAILLWIRNKKSSRIIPYLPWKPLHPHKNSFQFGNFPCRVQKIRRSRGRVPKGSAPTPTSHSRSLYFHVRVRT